MDTSTTAQVVASRPKKSKGVKGKKKKVKEASSSQPEESPVTAPPEATSGAATIPDPPAKATKSQVLNKSKKKKTKSKSKKKSKKSRSKSRKSQDDGEKDSTIPNESIAGEDPEPEEIALTEAKKEEEQELDENASSQLTSGKPQVWIRLRPNATPDDNAFEVMEDGKGIQMTRCQPEKNSTTNNLNTKKSQTDTRHSSSTKENRKQKQAGKPNFAASNPLPFSCDGVVKNVNQDQVYGAIADQLVVKAMDGVSGLILSVGTKASGKSFTLFGSLNKFQHRGLVPRCLERIFQICATKADQVKYRIGMAIHEIRDNKILDLLTLQPQNQPTNAAASSDGDGCNGSWHQIWSAEHGFGLLIRALTCQKEIPRESWAKPHTLVLIDIHGEACSELHKPSNVIKSRITFVKFGAIPERENQIWPSPSPNCRSASQSFNHVNGSGCPDKPGLETIDDSFPQHSRDGCVCCKRRRNGPLAEAIGIRQDLGFLQRMCSQAGKEHRSRRSSNLGRQMGKGGMSPTTEPLPRLDHHFRMSKLTYCLKDIINGRTEIRILLHLRPEWSYWRYNLEILRFGNQVKFVPYGLSPTDSNKFQPRSSSNMILEQFLTGIPPNVADVFIRTSADSSSGAITENDNTNVGIAYSDRQFKTSHGLTDDQVQELFRIFRSLWASAVETGTVSLDLFRSSEADGGTTRVVSDTVDAPRAGTAPNANGTSSPETTSLVDQKGKSASGSESAFGGRSSNYNTESLIEIDDQEKEQDGAAGEAPKIVGETMMDKKGCAYTKHEEGGEGSGGLDTAADSYFHYSLQGNDADDKDASSDNISKKEAWTKFAASDDGSQLLERLGNQRKQLAQIAREHEDAISETSVTLSRLTNLQAELNLIQQNRFLAGDKYDAATGNVLIGPRERQVIQAIKTLEESKTSQAARLEEFKSALFTAKQEMDAIKAELDATFLRFSKGYPTPNDLDSPQLLYEANLFCGDGTQVGNSTEDLDLDQSKKFDQVRRVAEKQAKGYFKAVKAVYRPPWVSY